MMLAPYIHHRLWSPWDSMGRFQEELNRLFQDMEAGRGGFEFPTASLTTGSEGAGLTVEVPGIAPKDLEVTVQNDTVTIRGARPEPKPGHEERMLRHERFHGEFARSFALPFKVNTAAVTASCMNGLLRVTLPRIGEEKPLTVKIQES
jgi:HSP20 family protein